MLARSRLAEETDMAHIAWQILAEMATARQRERRVEAKAYARSREGEALRHGGQGVARGDATPSWRSPPTTTPGSSFMSSVGNENPSG